MTDLRELLRGLWLPLVTPFRDGELDEASLRRLARHYAAAPSTGLSSGHFRRGHDAHHRPNWNGWLSVVAPRFPPAGVTFQFCLGLSGAGTHKMRDALDETAAWPIDGYLIASPYYARPSQRGLLPHFTQLADHASWPIVLYNIPYRTGVMIENDTLLLLAEHPNIVGMKVAAPTARRRSTCCGGGPRGFACSPARTRSITTRWSTAPTARSCLGPSRDRRLCSGAPCCGKVTRKPRRRSGTASPNSPVSCSLSRARRRPSIGWHAPG